VSADLIDAAFADLARLEEARAAVLDTIASLDRGELRVAEKVGGEWIVHETWLGNGAEIVFPRWPYALHAIRPDYAHAAGIRAAGGGDFPIRKREHRGARPGR